uniref:Uncharacterized protein n=1 Tax=Triticum urartu TaxID=4572 RepID=A0A8R7TQT1_TRIUA
RRSLLSPVGRCTAPSPSNPPAAPTAPIPPEIEPSPPPRCSIPTPSPRTPASSSSWVPGRSRGRLCRTWRSTSHAILLLHCRPHVVLPTSAPHAALLPAVAPSRLPAAEIYVRANIPIGNISASGFFFRDHPFDVLPRVPMTFLCADVKRHAFFVPFARPNA